MGVFLVDSISGTHSGLDGSVHAQERRQPKSYEQDLSEGWGGATIARPERACCGGCCKTLAHLCTSGKKGFRPHPMPFNCFKSCDLVSQPSHLCSIDARVELSNTGKMLRQPA